MLGRVVAAPVSVLIARIIVHVAETASAAKNVLVHKGKFQELAAYLDKIQPLLHELQERNFKDAAPLMMALESLEKELDRAKVLISRCSSKSRIYLLVNSRSTMKQVEDIAHHIGQCLRRVPMASMNLSLETREATTKLAEEMKKVEFKASVEESEVLDKIESGIKAQRVDSAFSNELLLQIAAAVGASVDSESLRKELEEFKKQAEQIALEKKEAERLQLEQLIGILSASDAATSIVEKDVIYHRKKNACGSQALPALQSFICPIMQEIMDDPAEIASGQTFERSAIEKWFAAGNRTCPTTKVELESLELRPNIALRSAIEEWRERNTVIGITSLRPKLLSASHEEVRDALLELLRISEGRRLHKYWIASEGLLPEIVKLLGSKQRDTRKNALATLSSLAEIDENKVEMVKHGVMPPAVHSLARDIGESRAAVKLLLKLSKYPGVLKELGKIQGSILLLVTILRSEDNVAVEDARQLLANLSQEDENVVLMAEANHFEPMVSRFEEGSNETKELMASSLAKLKLADGSTAPLEEAVVPLVSMLSSGQASAVDALENLSTIPRIRETMIAAGAVPPLLRILLSLSSAALKLKQQAASTLANIVCCEVRSDSSAFGNYSYLLSEVFLSQLLGLVNFTDRSVQAHLLRALGTLCSTSSGSPARVVLRQAGATHGMMQLIRDSNDPTLQVGALKLLLSLSGDGAGEELKPELNQPFLRTLVKLISCSDNDEARAAALGILANLPQDDAHVLDQLLQADVLPTVASLLSNSGSTRSQLKSIDENAVGALLLFSRPFSVESQVQAASYDVIPRLVELLVSGTSTTKARAATVLANFSESSARLTAPIVKKSRGWMCFSRPQEQGCPAHGGKCSVKSSFCLVEAAAIEPLVQMLGDKNSKVTEAALTALATLLYDETWKEGLQVVASFGGVKPLLPLLMTGSGGAKEKAAWMLERFFRLDQYKEEFGSAAQMPLIDLAQKGNSSTRQLAAKILAHLNILHNQSSYF